MGNVPETAQAARKSKQLLTTFGVGGGDPFWKKKNKIYFTRDVGERQCEGGDGKASGQGDTDGRRCVTRPRDVGTANNEDEEE